MICFVCEDKTEYELRMSDWSSDVCTSDLIGDHRAADDRGAEQPRRRLGPRARALEGQGEDHREHDRVEQADRQRDEAGGRAADGPDIEAQPRGDPGGDRKSEGSGKGGSGRVDLVGLRLSKKKTKTVKAATVNTV